MSRPFLAFLVFAAMVLAGFVVAARVFSGETDVLPAHHTRGPSRPNADPPRITPATQAGITITVAGVVYGDDTEVALLVHNHSAYPFALADPFVTAVWNGREYAPVGRPRDPNTGALVPRTIPPGGYAIARPHFPWAETTRYSLILVRGTSRGRALEWESGLPGVNRALNDRLGG